MLTTATIERLLKPYQYRYDGPSEKLRIRLKKDYMEQVVLEIIHAQGHCTSESLSKHTGVSMECANKNLRKLRDSGLIVATVQTGRHKREKGAMTTTRKNIYRLAK